MALRKRVYTDEETVITAGNLNDIQDAVIALEDGLFSLDNDKSGEVITITDASKRGFLGLNIYGKTTQDGTPTPDNPVDLVNIGEGSITINVNGENDGQSMTIATPNGLPGIPVTSGGNYTDANGQQWICDEIDLARGVYVQRVKAIKLVEISAVYQPTSWLNKTAFFINGTLTDAVKVAGYASVANIVSTHFKPETPASITSAVVNAIGQGNNSDLFLSVSGLTDAEAMKAWIADNTPTVQYMLATPIETPLSEEELAAFASLHTYKDNTTVSNDAGAWMALDYVMDAKKYIDSLVGGGIAPARVE